MCGPRVLRRRLSTAGVRGACAARPLPRPSAPTRFNRRGFDGRRDEVGAGFDYRGLLLRKAEGEVESMSIGTRSALGGNVCAHPCCPPGVLQPLLMS